MNRYLILLSIGLISFSIVESSALEWKGIPSEVPIYKDPIREYYDLKHLENMKRLPYQEPVYYSAFFIEPIVKAKCNSWIPVYGIVPDKGLLVFSIISGDYVGFANVSHLTSYYLLNYFYLPCTGMDHAQLNVTYIWNDNKDQEIYPNTKVKDLGIDRHFIHASQSFKIQ